MEPSSSMHEDLEVNIDLFNIEDEKFKNFPYILTSPRSLEACSQLGIKPIELLPKDINDLKEEYLPRGVPLRTISAMHRESERERQNKLHMCINERQKIVDEEESQAGITERFEEGYGSDEEGRRSGDDDEYLDDDDNLVSDLGDSETLWPIELGSSQEELDGSESEFYAQKQKPNLSSGYERNGRGILRCSSTHSLDQHSLQNIDFRDCSSSCHHLPGPGRTTYRCQGRASSDAGSVRSLTLNHTRRSLSDVRPVTDPLLKAQLGGLVNEKTRLRAKDQKILSLMAAKQVRQAQDDLLADIARVQWQSERSIQLAETYADDLRHRRTLEKQRQNERQERRELQARLEQMKWEKKQQVEEEIKRKLQMSQAVTDRQLRNRALELQEKHQEEVERKRMLEMKLQKLSMDDVTYKNEHLELQQHKICHAISSKASSDYGLQLKTQQRNQLSQQKHAAKMNEIRQQSLESRMDLINAIALKHHQSGEQLKKLRQDRQIQIQQRQRELDKKIEQSKSKLHQMEDDLKTWREDLLYYRKMQEMEVEKNAKATVVNKSRVAYMMRSEKQKKHKENIMKLSQAGERCKKDAEKALAEKEERIRALQVEREQMIQESRVLAQASQVLRQQLKINYSANDLDQLSKRTMLENQILNKKHHYISRYNPLNTSGANLR